MTIWDLTIMSGGRLEIVFNVKTLLINVKIVFNVKLSLITENKDVSIY